MAIDWHDVAAVTDVREDEPLSVLVDGKPVGLFRVGGKLYANEDVCPHAEALLSEGFIDGDEVQCALHGAAFHIPTGACRLGPADRDLETYAVKVEAGRILVGPSGG